MTTTDLKEHLNEVTARARRLITNDLLAIPESIRATGHGGCSRTALHVVAECALVNGFIAGYLLSGKMERRPPEERDALLATFDTTEKTVAFLDSETEKLLAAFAQVDPETLFEVVDSPLGRPMSRFAIAELPATHMMYHDGQLNYMQTLHGDSEMHWG